jgi:hypothetical protein
MDETLAPWSKPPGPPVVHRYPEQRAPEGNTNYSWQPVGGRPPRRPGRPVIQVGGPMGHAPVTKAESLIRRFARGGGFGEVPPEYRQFPEGTKEDQPGAPGPAPKPGAPGIPGGPEGSGGSEGPGGIFNDRRMEGRRPTNVDSASAPFSTGGADFIGSVLGSETEVG